jgi:DeoR family transcriptional regulator, suf operon transcriptional repressor
MTDLGFQAQLKNLDTDATLIQATNCIYHDLAQKHTEVCEFDKVLISCLLDVPIEQTSCMAEGEYSCTFKISKR